MSIQKISTERLRRMGDQEGFVLQGCGGDPEEWLDGINEKEFGRYIEIFGGSGAVLLGKEPSKFEVYNDIEGELVNFFRVVKNRPAELLLELDLLPLNSREEFASWLHLHDKKYPFFPLAGIPKGGLCAVM